MSDEEKVLLFNENLTAEEEALRAELLEWCRAKLAKGHRPIPLQAALTIAANQMKHPPADWRRTKPFNWKP